MKRLRPTDLAGPKGSAALSSNGGPPDRAPWRGEPSVGMPESKVHRATRRNTTWGFVATPHMRPSMSVVSSGGILGIQPMGPPSPAFGPDQPLAGGITAAEFSEAYSSIFRSIPSELPATVREAVLMLLDALAPYSVEGLEVLAESLQVGEHCRKAATELGIHSHIRATDKTVRASVIYRTFLAGFSAAAMTCPGRLADALRARSKDWREKHDLLGSEDLIQALQLAQADTNAVSTKANKASGLPSFPAQVLGDGFGARTLMMVWGQCARQRILGTPAPADSTLEDLERIKNEIITDTACSMYEISLRKHQKAFEGLSDLHRESVAAMCEMFVAVGQSWASNGFPQISLPHKLAAALMATSVPEEHIAEIEQPWTTFMVAVPNGILPPCQIDGKPVDITHVGLTRLRAQGSAERVQGPLPIPPEARVPGAGWEQAPVLFMLSDTGPGRMSGWISYHAMDTLSALVDPAWFGGLQSIAGAEPSLDFSQGFCLIGRLLLGVMIEVDNPDHRERIRRGPPSPSTKPSNPRGRGLEPRTWTVEIRRDVRVDLRRWVREQIEGKTLGRPGKAPSVQVLVRGHHKRQRCGPHGMERRWIHIEPYWRGPLDAPIGVREHRIAEDPTP